MTSISSNCSSIPLHASQSWSGKLEACNNFGCISVLAKGNTGFLVTINHCDKLANVIMKDEYPSEEGVVFAQVQLKSSYFFVSANNNSGFDQAKFYLVTKLSNIPPDNMNVQLDSGDRPVVCGQYSVDSSFHPISVDDKGSLITSIANTTYCCTVTLMISPIQVLPSEMKTYYNGNRLKFLNIYNDNTYPVYVRLYDMINSPATTDFACLVFVVLSGTNVNMNLECDFDNAIWAVASTNWGNTGDFGYVNANSVVLNAVLQ